MEEIRDGSSIERAIVLNEKEGDYTHQIGNILEGMFGKNDGSYFVLSETTLESPDRTKKYRIIYVDDEKPNAEGKSGRHSVTFELS